MEDMATREWKARGTHGGWQRLFWREETFIWVNCDFHVQKGRSLEKARGVMVKLNFSNLLESIEISQPLAHKAGKPNCGKSRTLIEDRLIWPTTHRGDGDNPV